MSQPNLDFFRKRRFLVKAEVSEGVDPTPDPATDGVRLFDGQSSTEFDKIERNEDKDFFGSNAFVTANNRATIQGTFELYPPATPGQVSTSDADCARLLLPSAMAVTKNAGQWLTRYSPISSGIPSVTVYGYHVRRLMKIHGARGNITSLGIEIGQRFTGQVSLMGDYEHWETSAIPTVTLPAKVPVVASAKNTRTWLSTVTRGATESTADTPLADLLVWAKSLRVDFGNQLSHREYSSKSVNGITERQGTFTLRLATTDITNDFDPLWLRDQGIILEAKMRLYEVSGTPDADLSGLFSELGIRGQIETVTPTDIDGDDGWEISGPCVPSSSGNDEFYVGFGDDTFRINGTLPDGEESVTYDDGPGLSASGNYTAPLTWTVSSGTLPTGLSIDSGTGAITGTPSTAGTYSFTVTATDSTVGAAKTASEEFEVTISA